MFTVLGARGFVGSHLVRALRANGYEVFAPVRDDPQIFEQPLGHVLYCIGLTADFRTRPFATVEAHVSVLNRVLEHANFTSLVYLSSTRVYSGATSGREDVTLTVRSDDPSDLYNLTKLTGESICQTSGRENVTCVRLSNVIGEDTGSSNFVYDITREALAGRIDLRSALDSAKDYIGVADVAKLLPKIAMQNVHALYNVASGVKVSHRQIVEALRGLTGCEVVVADGVPTLTFPDVDISRIANEFSFEARPVLEDLP
ncbi:MAG: SDR family oxidoreductase, partial [Pseudomonadota bacterium]